MVVFKEGREIALVELPIAGLMSDERAEIVAAKAGRMVEAFAECGCTMHNAYMQLSLLALVVIPELRISDKGIVDVRTFGGGVISWLIMVKKDFQELQYGVRICAF